MRYIDSTFKGVIEQEGSCRVHVSSYGAMADIMKSIQKGDINAAESGNNADLDSHFGRTGRRAGWDTSFKSKGENWMGQKRTPGLCSMETFHQLADKGWEKGVAEVTKLATNMDAPTPISMRRQTVRGDHGDELDIHAVHAGRFDTAWSRTQRQSSRAPQPITIVVNGVVPSQTDESNLFWRGAAVSRVTDSLEAAGYRVKVVVAYATIQQDGTNWDAWHRERDEKIELVLLDAKDLHAPVDINALTTAIAHPASSRFYGLSALYTFAQHRISNCGFPAIMPGGEVGRDDSTAALAGEDHSVNGIKIGCSTPTCRMTAEEWIKRTINTIQGDIA